MTIKTHQQNHARMLNDHFRHPFLIEDGFKSIFKEFGTLGAGRIDILGVDKEDKLCIVELKTGKQKLDREQLARYRTLMGKLLLALKLNKEVRVIGITWKGKQEITDLPDWSHEEAIQTHSTVEVSSREIYGLKEPIQARIA